MIVNKYMKNDLFIKWVFLCFNSFLKKSLIFGRYLWIGIKLKKKKKFVLLLGNRVLFSKKKKRE